MNRRLSIGLAVLLSACGSASVAVKKGFDFKKVNRVAVIPFSDYPRRPGSGHIMTGAFEQALMAAGYEVVERAQAARLAGERKLDPKNPQSVKTLGAALRVNALLLGNITDFREPTETLTHVDVVDTHQDPVYSRRKRVVSQGGAETETREDVLEGYRTTRVVRREPRTVTVDGRLGVSARLVYVGDGSLLWSGSDAVRVWTFEDAARNVAVSILKAVKPTWPSQR